MNTWVHQMVSTRCLRRVTMSALVLGCAAIIAFTQYRRIGDFLVGLHSRLLLVFLPSIAAVLLVFVIISFVVALRHLLDPSRHPVVRRLASWDDPDAVALDAEQEARTPRRKSGGWLITDKYLIQSTFFRFDLFRFSDLLWAYKKVTMHSVNFIFIPIPYAKTSEAVLLFNGGIAEIHGFGIAFDALLKSAAEQAPWAFFGFSKELQQLYVKNPTVFCAAVDQRRHDCEQRLHGRPKP